MQYNFGQRGKTNGKADKQAAVPSWQNQKAKASNNPYSKTNTTDFVHFVNGIQPLVVL